MIRVFTMPAYAALLGMTLVRPGEAQEPSSTSQSRPLPFLTAMSAVEQTRLALSTAPQEVSSRASVYVLTPKGYTQTRAGTNGFSCLVEREMLETVEPTCYDAEGSATTLKARIYREELRAKGLSEDEVKQRITAAYREARLSAPRKPGIIYMLAPENYAWNSVEKRFWTHPPHYMFYAPYATQKDMGGPMGPTTPVVGWPGQPDAVIIVMAAIENGRAADIEADGFDANVVPGSQGPMFTYEKARTLQAATFQRRCLHDPLARHIPSGRVIGRAVAVAHSQGLLPPRRHLESAARAQ